MLKTIIETNKNLIIIYMIGKYSISETRRFESLFKEQLQKKPATIAINLRELLYVDSSGIGSFIRCMNMARKESIQFLCYDISEEISTVFELTKLDNYFRIMSLHEFETNYV